MIFTSSCSLDHHQGHLTASHEGKDDRNENIGQKERILFLDLCNFLRVLACEVCFFRELRLLVKMEKDKKKAQTLQIPDKEKMPVSTLVAQGGPPECVWCGCFFH